MLINNSKTYNTYTNLFYFIGNYGPIFLFLISSYLLYINNYNNYLFYFIIGYFINILLNLILKGIFRQPRPFYDTKKVTLAFKYFKDFFFQNGVPFNMFGMPSGHAQTSFYCLVFIYLIFKNTNLLFVYSLFVIIICYQRIYFGFHYFSQIIIGLIIGLFVGIIIYYNATNKIKGIIREKKDDNMMVL